MLASFMHASVSSLLMVSTALAGPVGGAVTAGNAAISGQGTGNVNITQSSQRVVIDWDSFDTKTGEQVNFQQPNSSAIALNRITNGSPTQFDGALNANGKVIIMNSNGIVFGKSARVDVNGLIATTANIADDRFMNDSNLVFDQAGRADAKIINNGQITVREAGLAGFVGPHVENNSLIQARMGKVQMASGSTFTLDLAGDQLVEIALDDTVSKQIIKNAGTIQVEGGSIILSAAQARDAVDSLISNTGVIEAVSATDVGGTILLDGPTAQIMQEGTVNASGVTGGKITIQGRNITTNGAIKARGTTGTGGTVKILAKKTIESTDTTLVDVSGASGGKIIQNATGSVTSGTYKAEGTQSKGGSIDWGGNVSFLGAHMSVNGATSGGDIHIGGTWANQSAAGWDVDGTHLDAAYNIFVSPKTNITAAATGAHGKGGEVVFRAQDKTYYAGTIDTRPGTVTGEAGRAEVSGNTIELATTQTITTGRSGRNGTVLLDPKNITITAASVPDALQTVKLAFMYALTNTELFGQAVALNKAGTMLAVGAPLNDTGGNDRGAVYVFTLDPNQADYSPVFKTKVAHNTSGITLNDSDNFGISVAFNGTGSLLAIGSFWDDTGGSDRGAVYLVGLDTNNLGAAPTYYRKLAHGVDGISLSNSDGFGLGVALNSAGNVLAVGSYLDSTAGTNRGAVYLINLNPGNLSGASSIGTKLVSGVGGLTLTNDDRFGYNLALNAAGDILAVGAQRDDAGLGANIDKGAAYLFSLDPNNLSIAPTMRQKIGHNINGLTLLNGDYFGGSIALNAAGNILAVGAFSSDIGGQDRGAAYLFDVNTADLTQAANLRQTIAHGSSGVVLANTDNFGRGIALNGTGDMLFVGASRDGNSPVTGGAAFGFRLDASNLATAAVLRNKITTAPGLPLANGDAFGTSVDFNNAGSIMAVGAVGTDIGGSNRGAVYLFGMDPSNPEASPVFRYKIAHNTSGVTLVDDDNFGDSVSLNGAGDMLAVGATGRDASGTNRGAVYIFNLDPLNLSISPVLRTTVSNFHTAGLTLTDNDNFGSGVELNGAGNILAVGAQGSNLGGTDRGAVFLFNLDPSNLATGATYRTVIRDGIAGLTLGDGFAFGRDVTLNEAGNIMAVGAYQDSGGGVNRGAVYLLNLDTADLTNTPTTNTKISHGVGGITLADGDNFGNSVDLNAAGDILAVGAPGTNSYQGGAYLILVDPLNLSTTPSLLKQIVSGTSGVTLSNNDLFGASVALTGDASMLAVGASADDTGGTDRGSVRIFETSDLFSTSITNPLNYNNNPGSNATLSASLLASLLSGANNVTLQANNDIYVNADILVSNASGDGGDLTLQAGRSVVFNANITTDNGDVNVYANDTLANGVVDAYRDAGAGGISMATGVSINAGSGTVRLVTRDGAGKTNSQSDDTVLRAITAGNILVETDMDIVLNGQLTTSATGNAIILSGKNFINNAGASALNAAGAGRYIVYSTSPADNVLGGITGFTKRYNTSYTSDPPASITGTDDKMFYSIAPVITITAEDKTKVYGANLPGFTYTSSGYIDGDTSAILTGNASYSTTANTNSDVNDYVIDIGNGTLANPYNYSFNFVDGTLSVTKAALTITAVDTSKVYGAAMPTLTANYSGLVAGDTAADISGLVLSTSADATSSVGDYAIQAAGATSGNYNITLVDGTLSITKAALTIKANNASKNQGDPNPVFTATYTGLVNGDTASGAVSGLGFTTLADASSPAGGYAITPGGATAANYNITYQNGTLTVIGTTTPPTPGTPGYISDNYQQLFIPQTGMSGNPDLLNVSVIQEETDASDGNVTVGMCSFNFKGFVPGKTNHQNSCKGSS